jgi:hypothetical protein
MFTLFILSVGKRRGRVNSFWTDGNNKKFAKFRTSFHQVDDLA